MCDRHPDFVNGDSLVYMLEIACFSLVYEVQSFHVYLYKRLTKVQTLLYLLCGFVSSSGIVFTVFLVIMCRDSHGTGRDCGVMEGEHNGSTGYHGRQGEDQVVLCQGEPGVASVAQDC